MERISTSPRLVTFALIVVVVAALYFAKPVLVPLSLAILLSFLLAPLVQRLEQVGVPRVAAVLIVVLLVFTLIGATGWLVAGQVTDLAQRLPEYEATLRSKLAVLREHFGGPFEKASATVKEIGRDLSASAADATAAARTSKVEIAQFAPGPLASIQDGVGPLVSAFGVATVVLVFVVAMLMRREDLRDRVIRLTGGEQINLTTQALDEASKRVSRYLLTWTRINGLYGATVGIGLAAIGIPNSILWGLLSGLLRFIPYIGVCIASAFPIFLSFAIFDGWKTPLETIGLFVVLELLTANVLEPWAYGARTGVAPLAILVAAVFWTWLWGGVGLVLATPLTVCLAVMGKYVPKLQFLAVVLGDEPVLPEHARLYQRLLAVHPGEAWDLVSLALKERSLADVYDTIVMPALCLAEEDRHRGELDSVTEAALAQGMRHLVDEIGDQALEAANELEDRTRSQSDFVARPIRALCLPARDDADSIAAAMLAQVLQAHGVEAEAVSVLALASEMADLVETRHADLVCISAVPPGAIPHTRYLYKRLSARFPDLPIVIGVWGGGREISAAHERIHCKQEACIVGTLAEVDARVQQWIEPLRVRAQNNDSNSAAEGA